MNEKDSRDGCFEERLLVELKRVVAEGQGTTVPEKAGRGRRRGWKPGLALAGGALALGIAGIFLLPMGLVGKGSPAYAVTRQSDGTIRVEIREFEDPDGLRRRLAEEGITVHIDYLPEGKMCDRPFVEPGPVLDHETEDDGTTVFTLDPADYQRSSVVIEAEQGGDPIHFYTAKGDVGECEPVDSDFDRPSDADHERGGEDLPN